MTQSGPEPKLSSGGHKPSAYLAWLDWSISLRLIIAAGVAVGLAAAMFVSLGGVNVSADTPDGFIARHLLHYVFKRSEASRTIGVIPPDDFSSASRVRLGAQQFDMECANCHGRPGYGQSVIALSMSPRPQYLPKVVGQFTDPELFRIVQHGVKYSAMPSWPAAAREDEVWSLVAFVRQLSKMNAKTYRDLTALPSPPADGPSAAGDPTLRAANPYRMAPPLDEFQYAAPAGGFADAAIQQTPVATCARCHGADGSGATTGGEAPNLTLQDPAYLQASLQAYTSGNRRSGFMQNIAAQLTSAQILALAHYYASLPPKAVAAPSADPAVIGRGQTIATRGIWSLGLPACANCHDSAGSNITGAPHLAAQSATFLRHELTAMQHGGRGWTEWWNPMPSVARALSPADVTAVAAYYATLPPARSSGGASAPRAIVPPPDHAADMANAKRIFDHDCEKCHAANGRGDREGQYPDLTLQTAPFVAQNLYAFRSGARPGVQMRQMTQGLSYDEMRSLAYYVDSLKAAPAVVKTDAGVATHGAALATRGDPARGIPACLSCHGAAGVSALPLIPRLQGQNVFYLRKKLNEFAQPYDRNQSTLNPMPMIARQLTAQERDDMAAYFAAAAPLQKTASKP